MPSYEVAVVRKRGADGQFVQLIIAPMEAGFQDESPANREQLWREFKLRAIQNELRGAVCLAWEAEPNRMDFIGPPQCHPFCSTLTMDQVRKDLNRSISW